MKKKLHKDDLVVITKGPFKDRIGKIKWFRGDGISIMVFVYNITGDKRNGSCFPINVDNLRRLV